MEKLLHFENDREVKFNHLPSREIIDKMLNQLSYTIDYTDKILLNDIGVYYSFIGNYTPMKNLYLISIELGS